MGSLQEALRKSGLAREDKKTARKRGRRHRNADAGPGTGGAPRHGKGGAKKGSAASGGAGDGSRKGTSDLERAWAARRNAEKAEKERARKARLADQEARRKRNLELDGIVEGRVLNVEDADVPRYFEHLGRIRRVMCTPEQRRMINDGRLGVVSLRGRYLIVEPDVLEAYRALADDLVPMLGGDEPRGEDDGEDNGESNGRGEYPPVPDDMI